MFQHNLDLLSVTETWFSGKTNFFNIKGYTCFRCDRNLPTIGGGTAIFIKNIYTFEVIDLVGPWKEVFQIVGVRVNTILGRIYIYSIYIPPNARVTANLLSEMTEAMPRDRKIILMGDFNAHIPEYPPFRSNRIGKLIPQLQEILVINVINDGAPTFGFLGDTSGSVLDLQFVSSELSFLCESKTIIERFGSDHCPVIITIPIKLATNCQSSTRLVLKKVD